MGTCVKSLRGTGQCCSLIDSPVAVWPGIYPLPYGPHFALCRHSVCAVCAPPSPHLGSHSNQPPACPAVLHLELNWSSGRASVRKLACSSCSVPRKNHFPLILSHTCLCGYSRITGSHLSPLVSWVLWCSLRYAACLISLHCWAQHRAAQRRQQ